MVLAGHAWTLAGIDIGLADPVAQQLGADPQLASDTGDHAEVLTVLLGDQLWTIRAALSQLGRIPPFGGVVVWHGSIFRSKRWPSTEPTTI